MERIAPIEIDHANLKIGLKGYDRAQVDILFERAKTEIKSLVDEVNALQSEINRLKGNNENYAAQENTLKDTLLIAQRTAEEVRANAHREADALVAQAHRTAEETQRQYQAKINDLRWELERTRMDKQKFASEFRATLEGYLRGLTEEAVPPPGAILAEPSESIRAVIDGQV
jgi:cell division initiation protein